MKRTIGILVCCTLAQLSIRTACGGTGEDRYFDALRDFRNGLYSRGYSTYVDSVDEDGFDETPEILYYVGFCYENGYAAGKTDATTAKEYYVRAAGGGNSLAKQALERIKSTSELKEIQARLDAEKKKLERLQEEYRKEEQEREKRRAEWRKKHDDEIKAHEEEVKKLQGAYEDAIRTGSEEAIKAADAARKEADDRHREQLKKLEDQREASDRKYEETIAELRGRIFKMQEDHDKQVEALNAKIARLQKIINSVPGSNPPARGETTKISRSSDSEDSPFGFAMFAPAQFPPVDSDILGFRLSVFYGRNNNVFGLDIGALASVADGDLMGLEISGLFNLIDSSSGSIQIGGIANICEGDFLGLQIGGIANSVRGEFDGLQIGTLNLVEGQMNGLQIGVFNNARIARGLQIGVVNHAEDMIGVQIGLINVIENSDCPFCTIINARF